MSPAGTRSRCLTDNASSDGWPSWSPDGRQLAFDSDRDGNYEIYVMSGDGSDVRRLTHHPAADQAPVWVVLGEAQD